VVVLPKAVIDVIYVKLEDVDIRFIIFIDLQSCIMECKFSGTLPRTYPFCAKLFYGFYQFFLLAKKKRKIRCRFCTVRQFRFHMQSSIQFLFCCCGRRRVLAATRDCARLA
jgi:hypothetical protein